MVLLCLLVGVLSVGCSLFGRQSSNDEAVSPAQQTEVDVAGVDGTDRSTTTLAGRTTAAVAGQRLVYDEALAGDWQDWSWSTSSDVASSAFAYSGETSFQVTIDGAWSAFYLHTTELLDARDYDLVRFWVHGGEQGGQQLRFVLADGGTNFLEESVEILPRANEWTLVEIELSTLGASGDISGLAWQDNAGEPQATFYIDDLAFVDLDLPPTPTPAPVTGPTLRVDAAAVQHPISPEIYGINYAEEALADELNLPVRRWGGNATTRYNWQLDTANRASDWFFENIPEENDNPELLPLGSAADRFVQQDQRTGTKTMLTVPLIGWTPASREEACGFSVARYGAQQATDPYRADCGNGLNPDGEPIANNDPSDTSTAVGPDFVQAWIEHLTAQFGTAAEGGVAYYSLDNEPMLWNHTHRDVHPEPVGYDELRDRTYTYAAAVKAADPTAQTLGPVLWGWTAYEYSALDAAAGGSWWNKAADRRDHGGVDLVPWYLQQMRDYEAQNGTRILDFLDLHYYPAAEGVALAPVGGAATQALRLRSTRSLWDDTYTDESWIEEPVRLIPRMRDWVDKNYPGTKLALTEYNWGALDHINGALAQADVLGIFGREALDLATLWAPLEDDQPWAYAFRLYRNYDGQGSTFGDQSLGATSSEQDVLSLYAARRSGDSALTIMVINKSELSQDSRLALENFAMTDGAKDEAESVQVYRYSASNATQIVHEDEQLLSADGAGAFLTMTFPPESITLLVIE